MPKKTKFTKNKTILPIDPWVRCLMGSVYWSIGLMEGSIDE